MNVKQRYRRYLRRRQTAQAPAKTRRIHLLETLEVRAAPGSMLVMPPAAISAMTGAPTSNEVLPAPETQKGHRLRASTFAADETADTLLPVDNADFGTSQLTVMGGPSPARLSPAPTHDSPSSEDPLSDETSLTNADPPQPGRSSAIRASSSNSSFSGSSSSPTFGGPSDAPIRTLSYPPANGASWLTRCRERGPRAGAAC